LIKIIILEENFKWHLEAFASELFICLFLMLSLSVKKKVDQYIKAHSGLFLSAETLQMHSVHHDGFEKRKYS